jgi:hypothetical protein
MVGVEKAEETAVSKEWHAVESKTRPTASLPLCRLAREALRDSVVISGLAFVAEN